MRLQCISIIYFNNIPNYPYFFVKLNVYYDGNFLKYIWNIYRELSGKFAVKREVKISEFPGIPSSSLTKHNSKFNENNTTCKIFRRSVTPFHCYPALGHSSKILKWPETDTPQTYEGSTIFINQILWINLNPKFHELKCSSLFFCNKRYSAKTTQKQNRHYKFK